MKATILLYLLILPYTLFAQKSKVSCKRTERYLGLADSLDSANNYPAALEHLIAALTAARQCGESKEKDVKNRIAQLFTKIEDLKVQAENSANNAKKQKEKADKETKRAKDTAAELDIALKVANALTMEKEKALDLARIEQSLAMREKSRADSTARITEASRLTTLAIQYKDSDPTLALQLVKLACDTSKFYFNAAIEELYSILSSTNPASYYKKKFTNRQSIISSAAMACNGRYIAIGNNSGTIQLWDSTATVEWQQSLPVDTFRGHNGAVLALAISNDGDVIASGGMDKSVFIWNVQQKKSISTSIKHEGGILSIDISKDKRFVVSSSEDKTVIIWDAQSGKMLQSCSLTYGNALQVRFSPDGNHVAMAGNDELIKVWEWRPNKIVTLEGHRGAVRCVSFSQDDDGTLIASGGDDKIIKIWDWKNSKLISELPGHQNAVLCLNFSPFSNSLVSGGNDNIIKVWDYLERKLYCELRGHQKSVFAVGFLSKDKLYSSSYDQSMKIWEWKQDFSFVDADQIIKNQFKPAKIVDYSLIDPRYKKHLPNNSIIYISEDKHFLISQTSNQTIQLFDYTLTSTSKPVFSIQTNIKSAVTLSINNMIIKTDLYCRNLYLELRKGKLIPNMTSEDRTRFLNTNQ